jgi:hypothetical protein
MTTLRWSALLPAWLQGPVPGLPLALGKEVREVAGAWVLAMPAALVAAAGILTDAEEAAVLASFLCAILMIVMGAAVFGHEFAYRTVSLLLVQPVARAMLWRRKMGALALAIGSVFGVLLVGAALAAWLTDPDWGTRNDRAQPLLILGAAGVIGGLLVAPWLTLLCRSTLAGAVFTVSLPALAFSVSFLASFARFGTVDGPATQQFQFAVALAILLAVGGLAPFLGFRAFGRLEGLDATGRPLRLPRWASRAAPRTGTARAGSGWLGRAVGKELRLQTPSYVLAALFLLAIAAALGTRLAWPEAVDSLSWVEPLSLLYVATVALLVGALACAEDRQSGAMHWHLVQPVAAARQWAVKAGVALVLALGLTVLPTGLAAAVATAAGAHGWLGDDALQLAAIAGNSVVLCSLGLYTSSLAPTALRAVLWAVPPALGFELMLGMVVDNAGTRSDLWNLLTPAGVGEGGAWFSLPNIAAVALAGIVVTGLLAVLQACAYGNFRRVDSPAGRVLWHLAALLAGVAVGVALLGAGLGTLHAVAPKPAAAPSAGAGPEIRWADRPVTALARCEGNLLTVGWATRAWVGQHSNAVPAQLPVLVRELARPEVLVCPADTGRVAALDWGSFSPSNTSYEIVAPTGAAEGAQQILARCPIHRLVVYADGSVSPERTGAAGRLSGSFLPHNYRLGRFVYGTNLPPAAKGVSPH